MDARIIRCDCGGTLDLEGFTNTCPKCSADYNWNGQRLAPRSQWGEETGESLADIMGGRRPSLGDDLAPRTDLDRLRLGRGRRKSK